MSTTIELIDRHRTEARQKAPYRRNFKSHYVKINTNTEAVKPDMTTKQKVCPICHKAFTVHDGFREKRKSYCYECVPDIEHRVCSKTTYIKRAIKHQLILYKGGKCERCGYNLSEAALQFHHKDQKEKDFNISGLRPRVDTDMSVLYAEVDKCELLCANCHAIEHYAQDKPETQ